MPRPTREKIGEIHRVTYEKTFIEKAAEVVGGILGFIFIIGVLGAFFG